MDQEVELTLEQIEVLEEQTKRHVGFWTKLGGGALSFAILFHVIVIILGAIWIFQIIPIPEKKIDFMPGGGGGGGERGAETKVQSKKRAQITPTTNVKRVFADGAKSQYSIPDPGDTFGEMATLSSLTGGGATGGLGGSGTGKGFGSGSGSGMGSGKGMGKLFGLIPETMSKRCSKEDRQSRLKENGGTPECEEAVMKGLRWLKANQNPDGSWGTANAAAMTGLALLAYFGHCETPISEEFGESCTKAIVYLVGVGMKTDGMLSANAKSQPGCYEHAIATYAIGEAATFCTELQREIPNLMEVAEKAGQFIIDNQNENGGWAYSYVKTKDGHTDSSIVGWQLQALKACSHTQIKYKGMNSAAKKGLEYLAGRQAENGSFGYTGPGGKSLTGVGVLCYQMWGQVKSKEARNGVKFIKENFKLDWNTADSDLYSHYYASQAMMQAGGSNWRSYNRLFRDQLLDNQNSDGSWKDTGHKMHGDNPVYRTCLCTLMLEVYYRFLSTGGGLKSRHDI